MSDLLRRLAILRGYNRGVEKRDPTVAEEARDRRTETESFTESRSAEDVEREIEKESIVLRRARPVLAVKDNVAQLVFEDKKDSETWGQRLKSARPALDLTIPAVGRIELRGGGLSWVGTGWLVAEDVIVTNRHVAEEFVAGGGDGLRFKMGAARRIEADIDFLEEIDNPHELVFAITRPLHVEPKPGPDVAFFRVAMTSGDARLAQPIKLAPAYRSDADLAALRLAVIGYPASDSRVPEPDLMRRIYGDVYDKKRLAPGGVTRIDETRLWHDCTTLGGNSGSVVLDLDQGAAVGLHFSGAFLTTNYAVRADVVASLLKDVQSGPDRRPPKTPPRHPDGVHDAPPAEPRAPSPAAGSASLSIPLTIKVSIQLDGARVGPVVLAPATAGDGDGEDALIDDGEEAVPDDYRDRDGYLPQFLGEGAEVALPEPKRGLDDILTFKFDGEHETELRYEHFSVLMSRSRRMCLFSACNIDGQQSRPTKRSGWRFDPRIPRAAQIMKECYGAQPRFSRGHMTRREDPAWGPPETRRRGSDDSMHVTNATPQMQGFNAPIWLALEDYALENARRDDMRISVFTGPYFTPSDPTMYGVRIPLSFWKVIAFIHDESRRLCATGYEMNQEKSLQPEDEFVFGAFKSPQLGVAAQTSIRTIEAKSGFGFGGLAGLDPLGGEEESVAGGARPLARVEQIRFFR